ncbi:MAG: Mrp/NBP35 family ATP-binding protein [Bacillota bacterium]|nr:Mrp/NBP35 family ATP-binding protein [Bacillota bacterium]MDI9415302.1 Mrp/NBP35 family ATP-binding protein [Bacillota bacterium]HOB87928.1 Mrp/NBP35 family ATP-binding protein [Bacillota bacterium]HOJ56937.1 Mrp/NBP35 family ATP-binding protein [Bacillota bacterium]HOL01705.1 Mrp/NBP35 family ATP-binding protein [Bacillota bacterium]
MEQGTKSVCEEDGASGCKLKQPIETLPEGHFNSINRVIAVMSGKGGVGKSSLSALIAVKLARDGYTVGLLDADITGPSIPKMFGINASAEAMEFGILPVKSGLGIEVMSLNLLLRNEDDPVIWRGPLIAGAVRQFWTDVIWGKLDYLIVDLPPGTGDVPITVMQSLPLDGVVVVSSPQDVAAMIVRKAMRMASMMKTKILGLIENMSYAICPKCGEVLHLFGPSKGADLARSAGIPYLGAVRLDPDLARLCDLGRIEEYDSEALTHGINWTEIVEKGASKQ